jgi:hypothetical protein
MKMRTLFKYFYKNNIQEILGKVFTLNKTIDMILAKFGLIFLLKSNIFYISNN